MTILVPDSDTLPGSIGNAAISRNGLKNVATTITTAVTMMPAGIAMRRNRTKRLCRAAARNTRSPSFRPIWRDPRTAGCEIVDDKLRQPPLKFSPDLQRGFAASHDSTPSRAFGKIRP